MTVLSAALRALAAEPAPAKTKPSVAQFTAWRITTWASDRGDLRETARAWVAGSTPGSWERGVYDRCLALCEAHAINTGAAS